MNGCGALLPTPERREVMDVAWRRYAKRCGICAVAARRMKICGADAAGKNASAPVVRCNSHFRVPSGTESRFFVPIARHIKRRGTKLGFCVPEAALAVRSGTKTLGKQVIVFQKEAELKCKIPHFKFTFSLILNELCATHFQP